MFEKHEKGKKILPWEADFQELRMEDEIRERILVDFPRKKGREGRV